MLQFEAHLVINRRRKYVLCVFWCLQLTFYMFYYKNSHVSVVNCHWTTMIQFLLRPVLMATGQ